jgi:predicted O-methyltransferase YrrM
MEKFKMNIEDLKTYPFKGFMDEEEALRLYELAREASRFGPCLEIGSYCGRSAAYLGLGCRENGGVLYSIDHHRGSEEQQPGQEYFDPDLVDPHTGLIDTFPLFLKTITNLGLEGTVIPLVSSSTIIAETWATPLSLVFIDGGHTFEAAFTDYSGWVSHIMPGGFLVIHDIFPDPAEGGQAPYCIYRMALASGLFTELPLVKTLGVLKRAGCGEITVAAGQRWKEMLRAEDFY